MSTSVATTVADGYGPVIGLDVHVELGTRTKISRGCPVCPGLPSSLPVANDATIKATIRIGPALNCQIAAWRRFARKNYFYLDAEKLPDQPVRRATVHRRLAGRRSGR